MASTKTRGRPRKCDRDKARAIRKAVKEGLTVPEAAQTYGLCVSTITRIVKGVGSYANTL